MTLAEQIAHLRQLAITDPNTTLLDLTIINILDELAEAVRELHGHDPPQGSVVSSGIRGANPRLGQP